MRLLKDTQCPKFEKMLSVCCAGEKDLSLPTLTCGIFACRLFAMEGSLRAGARRDGGLKESMMSIEDKLIITVKRSWTSISDLC